jgi:hypothetical protein
VTEELARVGGPLAAAGLALVILARPRPARLAGLGLWAVGAALLVPVLAPSGHRATLAGGAVVGVAVAAALAVLFVRVPWAVPFLALAAAPARVPVSVGDTEANLLVPLYLVVLGAAFALAWELARSTPRSRELGILAWPVAALVGWFALSLTWTIDVREGAIDLLFFLLPFGLLALVVARLPWRERPMIGLFGLLQGMALLFALVGIGQWLAKDVFWNPKVIVGNETAAFFRVNSLFWDPSIYGRFLVVAILAVLVVVLLRLTPRWDPALAGLIVVLWVGLFFSFSQSSFVALVAGVLIAVALAVRSRTLAVVAAAALLAIPVGAAPAGAAAAPDDATGGRATLVRNGIEIALDHPLIGVGIGAFQQAYAEKLDLKRKRPPIAASHTTPVTVAAETGFPGLLLLFWLVAAALAAAFRGAGGATLVRATSWAAGLAVAAIAVQSLFYNAFFEDPMTWGALGLIVVAATTRREVRT